VENQKRYDLIISGVGSSAGGVFDKVQISGHGKVNGDVDCNDFTISGVGSVEGSLKAKTGKFEGVVSIKGSVAVETVENNGLTNVNGDCNAEVFISKGACSIDGLLNAGDINISLYGPCRAKEIGGEKIKVKMGQGFSLRRLIKSIIPSLDINTGLCTETIEGDDICLEYTKAKVVRGNNVTIGVGCHVELVEYKGRFEKSDKSVVVENKKMG
jgi:cytoskeletal protein CcmA (bactofilin family)